MAKSIYGALTGVSLELTERETIHVLHVDVEAGFLKTAKQCLKIHGQFEIETASSAEEAMKKLKRKKFDVIISDYIMPKKDGLKFLKELREEGNNIPFIVFTGKGREEVVIEALNLGADQYLNKTGNPETVYGELAHNICKSVERKRAEEKLKESEEKYRSLFENAKDVTLTYDLKGNVTSINKMGMKYGFQKDEIIGKKILRFVPKKYWPRLLKELAGNAIGKTVEGKIEISTPRGKKIADYISTPIIVDRKVVGVQTILRDITEQKKVEKELVQSEDRFRILMEEAPIGICNTDLNGKITYVNKRFEEAIGYSREEILGKNSLKLGVIPDETLKLLTQRMKRRLMEKPGRLLEGRFKRKDGKMIWAEIRARVIKKFKAPVGFQLAARDITERKKVETERKHFEEKLTALNTYAQNLNIAQDMEEIYDLTLQAVEKTLGFGFADILILDGKILCLVASRGESENLSLELSLDGEKGITVRAARTGNPILVPDVNIDKAYVVGGLGTRSELAIPIKIGKKILGVLNVESKELNAFDEKDQELLEILASHAATAISNLHYARNLLRQAQNIRESQEKFERLFMNNPEAVAYVDSNFRILEVNPRFTKLFGYSLDEIKGKHINSVIVPEDKIKEAMMFDQRASRGEAYQEDTVRKKKDGTLVPLSFSAAPLIIENKSIGHIAVYKDISQLKRVENSLKETLEKLEMMNEKLNVVGNLTRHDARNKLSAVLMNIFLVKQKLVGNHGALENLNEIEVACHQVERIFDFARTYEKLGVEELTYVNVKKCLEEAIKLFSDFQNIEIMNECHGLAVLADSLLRHLLYNLVDNSIQHGEGVSEIRIYYMKDRDQLKLIYEDNGVGISKAEKEKIFIEGYGKGTGYGLYLIRKICEVYGWTIQETGTSKEGARFTINISKISPSGKIKYQIN